MLICLRNGASRILNRHPYAILTCVHSQVIAELCCCEMETWILNVVAFYRSSINPMRVLKTSLYHLLSIFRRIKIYENFRFLPPMKKIRVKFAYKDIIISLFL